SAALADLFLTNHSRVRNMKAFIDIAQTAALTAESAPNPALVVNGDALQTCPADPTLKLIFLMQEQFIEIGLLSEALISLFIVDQDVFERGRHGTTPSWFRSSSV